MKTATIATFTFTLALAGGANAQPTRAEAPTYVEHDVAGDQVISFTGDELAGMTNGAYGDLVRRPPGAVRVGLIRPRLNFVSELRKSVESL